MVESAIAKRLAENKKRKANEEISVEKLLRDLTHKELLDFIVR
jgi:hypothetical protein